MRQKGFTMAELVVVVAVGAMVLLVALPSFSNILRRSRLDGAARQLIGDIRGARAQATMSGWEFQLVGYADGEDARANQYRLIGRSSTGEDWPDEDAEPFQTATQRAEPWVDIATLYPGIRLEPQNAGFEPRFELTFNSRGAAAMSNASFDPFQVLGAEGAVRAVRVSVSGGVRTE